MVLSEVQKLIAVMTATYPTFYKSFDADAGKSFINAWYSALKEYEYKDASIGLQRFIKSDSSGFPPSPGQVIAKMPSKYEKYLEEAMRIDEHNRKRLQG